MTDHLITPPPELKQQLFGHLITTPPELKHQWREEAPRYRDGGVGREEWLIERAAQWGYDQRGEVNEAKLQQARDEELEACCEWLVLDGCVVAANALRSARRPKPPSLKEQALAVLDPSKTYGSITQEEEYRISVAKADTIRRALEALPDD